SLRYVITPIIAEYRMVAENARPLGYIAKRSLSRWRRMRTSKNSVPLIPLKDFGPSPFIEHGIFIEAFEDCVSVRHKRMEVHRHDYVELFWLHGDGSVLIDFENYPFVGKIAHRHRTWSRPCLARKAIDRALYFLHSGILR